MSVHTYHDIFESTTFSFRIQKFSRPHVGAYWNRLLLFTGIPMIHSSTQGSSVISSRACAIKRTIAQLLLLWRHNGLLRGKKLDKNLPRHQIRRPHVIGFVEDLFLPLWRADLKMSGFPVEFARCVWMEAVFGKKNLRIQNYPDACGRGLKEYKVFLMFISLPKESVLYAWSWVVFCLVREANCKSVSFGIVVFIVSELSLQSVSKVAVKLQVPWTSNIDFD